MDQKPDDVPLTRAYLESLTTIELIRMADHLGMDIPPELDRIFIIEEMLDSAYADDTLENSQDGSEMSDVSGEANKAPNLHADTETAHQSAIESVPLPKQYNITFIEVMIRDPLWAFVFWEIKAQEKEQIEKSPDFEGYYLKVSSLISDKTSLRSPGVTGQETENDGVFTVPVMPADSAWYLGFTPIREGAASDKRISRSDNAQNKVDLCVQMKGDEIVLASSNPFSLPELYESPAGTCKQGNRLNTNPLVRLSGYGDFHILRYSERLFRAKKDAATGSYE